MNTNSPTDTKNFSSNHSSRSSTTSNPLLNSTDTTSNNTSLTTQSTSNQNAKSIKSTPKKIVASAESLSSENTLSQAQSHNIQKECLVISPNSQQSNFKTFKTLTLSSATSSPSHQQSLNSPFNKKTSYSPSSNNTSASYRTMPSQHHVSNKLANSFDQKPLNLPVNELFKRYELKRQAADSTITSDIHSSMNSLQPNQPNQLQSCPKKMTNELDTPRLIKKI